MSQQVRVAAAQAEPCWLDIAAGVDRVVDLIAEAARGGAQLVAFPETFLPGYPWWIWLDSPAWGMQFVARYSENSMTRDGGEMDRIAAAAADHGIHVALGFSERDGGSLYMAQAFIDECWTLLSVRRKLKPTYVERSVFGQGDGSDIQVHDTRLGRLGGLSCWEHFQPLTKYMMYSLGEQIHIAAWPGLSLYCGVATALGPAVHNAASLVYAVEGQTFVLALRGGGHEHERAVLRHGHHEAVAAPRRRVRADLRSRGQRTGRTTGRDRGRAPVRGPGLLAHRDRDVHSRPGRTLLAAGRLRAPGQPRTHAEDRPPWSRAAVHRAGIR